MEAVVKVKDLVQRAGRKAVLDGLAFEVYSGECFGIFGAGGSGKTTLIHILAGIDRFCSGTVEVMGCDIRKSESYKKRLGLVTQGRSLFQDLKVVENLDFIATLKNADKGNITPLVRRFELEDYLNEPAGTLEAGIYQRLSLACALLNAPKLLLVDELTDKIDLPSSRIIIKEMKEFLAGGGACVWAFSSIGPCGHMSRVGWLEGGKMTIFPPQEARTLWEESVRATAV